MSQLLFKRVTDPSQRTRFLFVGNCGPGVGMADEQLDNLLQPFSPESVVVPNPTSTFVFVIFSTEQQATKALNELEERGPEHLGRKLVLRYSEGKPQVARAPSGPPVERSAEQLGVPGLVLLPGFVSELEEHDLMRAVQGGTWQHLAKRRVQHYGWEFDYSVRSFSRCLGALPAWVQTVADRASQLPSVSQPLDQLTVNEYTPGVGLSPHIDTHSAFTGAIVSLSLGSDTVMAFRCGDEVRALLLPRRSLLVLAGEARHAWQHYIPHRKVDDLGCQPQSDPGPATEQDHHQPQQHQLVRGTRVSLTLRKIRGFPCDCAWPEHCDSRQGGPLPTRIGVLMQQGALPARGCMAMHTQAGHDSGQPPVPHTCLDQQGSVPDMNAQCMHQLAAASNGSNQGHNGHEERLAMEAAREHRQEAHEEMHGVQPVQGVHEEVHASHMAHMQPHTHGEVQGVHEPKAAHADQSHAAVERAAEQLESSHVHAVYDAIASHFSSTRFAIWPRVREFIASLPPGAVVADVGCGNGKYFGVRHDIMVLGSDRSAGLAEVAAQRLPPSAGGSLLRADVLQADGLHLPYRPGSADGALCIAVLHHVSSVARRRRMLQQLLSLLRPGGRGLVTVWAVEQEEPKKTLDKWTRIMPVDTSSTLGAGSSGFPVSQAGVQDRAQPSTAGPGGEVSTVHGATEGGADSMVHGPVASTSPTMDRGARRRLDVSMAGLRSGDSSWGGDSRGWLTSRARDPASYPIMHSDPSSHPVPHMELASHPVVHAEIASHAVARPDPGSHALVCGDVTSHAVLHQEPASHALSEPSSFALEAMTSGVQPASGGTACEHTSTQHLKVDHAASCSNAAELQAQPTRPPPGLSDTNANARKVSSLSLHGLKSGTQQQGLQVSHRASVAEHLPSASAGSDYMVPWHLPLHQTGRAVGVSAGAGAAVTAAFGSGAGLGAAQPAAAQATGMQGTAADTAGASKTLSSVAHGTDGAQGSDGFSHLGPARAQAVSHVCSDKGTVVYQRYYHLFEAGELEALVDSMPGCRRMDAFFDRSNWCVVFERA